MTLMSEIAALRAAIDGNARLAPAGKGAVDPASEPLDQQSDKHVGVDAFLEAVGATLQELGQDIDKFPRLTALTVFGLGLSLGLVFGSRVR